MRIKRGRPPVYKTEAERREAKNRELYRWREKNREHYNAYAREYYHKHVKPTKAGKPHKAKHRNPTINALRKRCREYYWAHHEEARKRQNLYNKRIRRRSNRWAANQRYYQKHREEIIPKALQYYHENREKCIEYQRKYVQKHRKRITQYMRDYYTENKERLQAQRREHKNAGKNHGILGMLRSAFLHGFMPAPDATPRM